MQPVLSIAVGVLMMMSLMATEPVEQKPGPAAEARTEQYYPHLVVGGGSNVILAVQNLGSEEGPFSLSLRTGDGESVSQQGKLLRPNGVGFWDVAQIVESRGGDLTSPKAYWIRLNGQSSFSATGIQTLTVPPLSQTSFYTDGFFGYDPGFNGGLVAVCDRQAVAYSLLQDRLTGDTNAVGVACFDLPEPPQ